MQAISQPAKKKMVFFFFFFFEWSQYQVEESVLSMFLCPAKRQRRPSRTDLLSPPGGPKLEKLGLMTALFDLVEASRPNTGMHALLL